MSQAVLCYVLKSSYISVLIHIRSHSLIASVRNNSRHLLHKLVPPKEPGVLQANMREQREASSSSSSCDSCSDQSQSSV